MIGKRVEIIPSTLADKAKTYEWLCQSDTTKYHMGPPHFTDHPIPSWEEYCDDFEDYYFDGSKPDFGRVYIIKHEDKEIGAICYASFHLKCNGAELDIWIAGEQNCGKGYGTEAIGLLADYLTEKGFQYFIIRPSARNKRAVRAYEKAGFKKVDDSQKAAVVENCYREEFIPLYGSGDYGTGDDVVLIKESSERQDV